MAGLSLRSRGLAERYAERPPKSVATVSSGSSQQVAEMLTALATGTASADTAAIQAAQAALPASGNLFGGKFVLQRGIYALNAPIVLGYNQHLVGQGRGEWSSGSFGATTLDARNLNGPAIVVPSNLYGWSIRDLNVLGAAGQSLQDLIQIGGYTTSTGTTNGSTINVGTTLGFQSSGTIYVTNGSGADQAISYTGKTLTSFTGCTGAGADLGTGATIYGAPAVAGQIERVMTVGAGRDGIALNASLHVHFEDVYSLLSNRNGLMVRGQSNAIKLTKSQFRQSQQWGIHWMGGTDAHWDTVTVEANNQATGGMNGGVWIDPNDPDVAAAIGITMNACHFELNCPVAGAGTPFQVTSGPNTCVTNETGTTYTENDATRTCTIAGGSYCGTGIQSNLTTHHTFTTAQPVVVAGMRKIGSGNYQYTDSQGVVIQLGATGGVGQIKTASHIWVKQGDAANQILLNAAVGAIQFGSAQDTGLFRQSAGIAVITNTLHQQKATPTYGASITPDASAGPWQTITVTNATAFAINAPTNPPSSTRTAELTIEIFNNSGGVMGAITWNGAFVFAAGAWANPASTKRRFARFEWNGANWICTGLASADY